MKNLKLLFCLIQSVIIFLGASSQIFATHQRAAEITYRHLSGLTYEITLVSYTYTPSPANAYRDYLTILWGDGTASEIPRVTINNLPDSITYNKYVGQHTFPGPATYQISCEDPNRNGGILNIPNSINTPLYIFSELVINPFLGGTNNSPSLLLPPVDNACVGQPFYHNPGAYDEDGDSLSYRLVYCRGMQGQVIPGYSYPPASNSLTLDPVAGDLVWDSPMQQGEFNIAILIEEWRRGQKIGSVLRDMQIIVLACNNKPPVITIPADTCIEAGKNLRFLVRAYDPDSNLVTLSGTGGPLILNNSPATLEPNPASGLGHTEAIFRWNTICEHVKKNSYQVFFKARDNSYPVDLVTIKSMKIKVVGPAPTGLAAEPQGNNIRLTWNAYTCPNATGYSLFRKSDSTGFIPGYCQTGVPAYLGYTKIADIGTTGTLEFLDDNNGIGLVRGLRYCYLLVARYPDGAESYASNEACATLKKDVAVITNVSISTTDPASGTLYLAWSMPTEIDPVQAPGPYLYKIYRSSSDNPALFTAIDSTSNLADTIRNETGLNTFGFSFTYRIDLYNITPGNRFLIGSSQLASSMYLTLAPHDRRMLLRWTKDVPWENTQYIIYRKSPGGNAFDSVGTSPVNYYSDKLLVNGETYCYRIKSVGKYSSPGFIEPIINYSQEKCGIPEDNDPPCPPKLSVKTLCELPANQLTWTVPSDTCPGDIAKYYIYYSSSRLNLNLLDSVMQPGDTVYLHSPAGTYVGCYAVMAVDSAGNPSVMSDTICVDLDGCPDFLYRLPNVFSPNGDEWNQLLKPFPYQSVTEVNIEIYDRWGRKVFKTRDPEILWNGEDMTTGQPCSDGVYYYAGEVYEITLNGIVSRPLHGSVTLLR